MNTLMALVLAATPLRIGVTLHPYASWTWNVTKGLPVEVVPLVPGDIDIGAYQPRPQDVARLATVDVLIENALGHDAFLEEMVKASGNATVVRINLNEETPLLWTKGGEAANSHTFLSLGNAMIQSTRLARAIANLKPQWRTTLERNAAEYSARLRQMRAHAVNALSKASQRRVITVHDGYTYLLQELGLELGGVIEPAHGLLPSAPELAHLLQLLQSKAITVVLSEESFPHSMAQTLEEAGARVVVVSHIATGEFTPERFERDMADNLSNIISCMAEKPR